MIDDQVLSARELHDMAIHATEYADVKLIDTHITVHKLIVLFHAPSGTKGVTLKLPIHRTQQGNAQEYLNNLVDSWSSDEI